MRDDQLRGVLHGLGIDQDTIGALALLPLVQVAWADGRVQPAERGRILEAAEQRGLVDRESRRLLDSWLRYRPSRRYLELGHRALVELTHRARARGRALDGGGTDGLVELCGEVAHSAGGVLGLGTVDRAERAALSQVAQVLGADRTHNWQALFDTLQEPPPVAGEAEDEDAADEDTAEEDTADEVTEVDGPPPSTWELRGEERAPHGAVPAARLVILGSDDTPDEPVPLVGTQASVGRRDDNTLVLSWDGRVSRRHCILRQEGSHWTVVDAGSTNGTLVNGELVLERRLLGDELIKLGDTVLRFELGT